MYYLTWVQMYTIVYQHADNQFVIGFIQCGFIPLIIIFQLPYILFEHLQTIF